jgi:hypothetical protein
VPGFPGLEHGGHAVTISGDTKYNENIIKYGGGADRHRFSNFHTFPQAPALPRRYQVRHTYRERPTD